MRLRWRNRVYDIYFLDDEFEGEMIYYGRLE